jgi:molecular chaperone GrpE
MKDGIDQSFEKEKEEAKISVNEEEVQSISGGQCSENNVIDELEEKDRNIEELTLRVKELEAENKELKESAARSRADLYNFRQRVAREREKDKKLARECSVLEMLPVLDNLDRALSSPGNADPTSVIGGVVMVQRQFAKVLNSMGVKEIPTKGEKFSPVFHEAVAVKEVDDPEQDSTIVEEFAKGYMLSDKVIRPAKVQVAKFDDSKKEQQ